MCFISLTSCCLARHLSDTGCGTAQPVTYLSLALTLATGAGVTAYYLHLKQQRLKRAPRLPRAGRACERCRGLI